VRALRRRFDPAAILASPPNRANPIGRRWIHLSARLADWRQRHI